MSDSSVYPAACVSVTVYAPIGTFLQSSVFVAADLSFRVKLVGDAHEICEPASVDENEKVLSVPAGSVCLMILTSPQFEIVVGTGATKSFTSEVNDDEERLLRNVVAKVLHVLVPKTPAAVKLIAASPNVPEGMERGALGPIGSVTEPRLFTAPMEFAPLSVS